MNKSLLILLMATAASAAVASTPVMSLPMALNDSKQITETISGSTYAMRGVHGEAAQGVHGGAVRLDGYSTYFTVDMSDYTFNSNALTISMWTACPTYPMMNMNEAENAEAAIISCLNDSRKTGFAFYLYSQGSFGFSCYINGTKKTIAASTSFPKYKWNHVVATIEKDSRMSLYLNGSKVGSIYVNGAINLPTNNLYIGKSHTDTKAGQFYLNTYNGIIDDIHIYNEVLSANEIELEAQASDGLTPDFNMPASHYASDLCRPRHHAMPSSNWMNESHGLTYYNNQYHLFFQKNANGPYMARLHWGHLVSDDLYNWTEEPIAIAPSKSYDLKGCWSGCVFTDDAVTGGEPWILYTGVDNARATIDLATPKDDNLLEWTKSSKNPVISGTPSRYNADFRDPYVFRKGANLYAFVGTSLNGVSSTSLHRYNSSTGKFDDTNLSFFTGHSVAKDGSFFEMSNVTEMPNGQWLFTATPLGGTMGVRTIYYVGSVNDNGTFSTSQSDPKTVELPDLARDGYGLLSPSIYRRNNKTIAIGIVPDKLATNYNYTCGYAHMFSFPREWSLDAQGQLVQKPYSGLEDLRSNTVKTLGAQTLNGEISLNPVEGLEIEVKASFTIGSAPFGIKILESSSSAVKIYYNPQSKKIIVDCSAINRKNNDGGIFDGVYASSLPVNLSAGETLKMHLFFDHSILDLFINDRWATSIRIFPTSASNKGVSVYAEGNTELQSLSAWTMFPIDETEPVIVDALDLINDNNRPVTNKVIKGGLLLLEQGEHTYSILGNLIH